MNDARLLKNTIFMASVKGCKNLVAEFFKFQRKPEVSELLGGCELLLNTGDKIKVNLGMLCMHISNIRKVDFVVDTEPMLLVLFQKMAQKKISKDLLSLVSRQFFKEIKQKYRTITNLSTLIIYVLKLFESQGDLMLSSNHCYAPTDDQMVGNIHSMAQHATSDTDLQIN